MNEPVRRTASRACPAKIDVGERLRASIAKDASLARRRRRIASARASQRTPERCVAVSGDRGCDGSSHVPMVANLPGRVLARSRRGFAPVKHGVPSDRLVFSGFFPLFSLGFRSVPAWFSSAFVSSSLVLARLSLGSGSALSWLHLVPIRHRLGFARLRRLLIKRPSLGAARSYPCVFCGFSRGLLVQLGWSSLSRRLRASG